MSKNNHVFQVLVGAGNQAILAAGETVANLVADNVIGKIGIFDAKTNLSVNASSTPTEIYIAVAVDNDGDGVVDGVKKSAGQKINLKGLKGYEFTPYQAPLPQIVTISDYADTLGGTEFIIRLEFRNQEIYKKQGYNQYSKAYSIITDGASITPVDANQITIKMVNAINNDPLQLVTAEAIAADAIVALTHGTVSDYAAGAVMTLADVAAIETFNATATKANKVYSSIKLTTNSLGINKFFQINTKYYTPRQTMIIPSLVSGFDGAGTITITQNIKNEQGSGYDVKMKEYEAAGWDATGPYRQYATTGLPKDELIYAASETAKYHQIVLTTEDSSYGGFQTFYNTVSNIIAIPQADTTTLTSIITVLTGITGIDKSSTIFTVDAGANVANNTTGTEILTATPSATATSYIWTQISGPGTATLTNKDTKKMTASDMVDGTYVFQVAATDVNGTVATDTVSVIVDVTP